MVSLYHWFTPCSRTPATHHWGSCLSSSPPSRGLCIHEGNYTPNRQGRKVHCARLVEWSRILFLYYELVPHIALSDISFRTIFVGPAGHARRYIIYSFPQACLARLGLYSKNCSSSFSGRDWVLACRSTVATRYSLPL